MLHKIVEPDKTDDKCNILLIFLLCMLPRLIVFFSHQTKSAFTYQYISRYRHFGHHMWVEIIMIFLKSVFPQRTSITHV